MQIARTGNPSRTQLFRNLQSQQSAALLDGDFDEANKLFVNETKFSKLEGEDTAEMFASAAKKREFWSSRTGRVAHGAMVTAGFLAPGALIGAGVTAAMGGSMGAVGFSAGLGAFVGAMVSTFLAVEGVSSLNAMVEQRKNRIEDYKKIEKALNDQGTKASEGALGRIPSKGDLQATLSQEVARAEQSGDIEAVAAFRDSLSFLSEAKGENLVEIFRRNDDRAAVGSLVEQSHEGIKNSQFRSFNVSQAVDTHSEPLLESYITISQEKLADLDSQIKAMTASERVSHASEFELLTTAREQVQEKMTQAQEGLAAVSELKRSESRFTSIADAMSLVGVEGLIHDREQQLTRDLSLRQAQVQVAQMG